MALTKVPSNLDAAVSVTQSQSDNSTNVATTAYVDLAISNLSDSAPAALNTLNEIAAALGDNENYAATTTAAIADKLPLSGGTMTGALTTPTLITGAYGGSGSAGDGFRLNSTDLYGQIDASDKIRLNVNGDSFLNGGNLGIGTTTPGAKLDVNSTAYVNTDSTQALRFTYNGSPRAMISAYGGEGELSLYRSS